MIHSGLACGQIGTFPSQVGYHGGAAGYGPRNAVVVCGSLQDPPAHGSCMYRSHLRHFAAPADCPWHLRTVLRRRETLWRVSGADLHATTGE